MLERVELNKIGFAVRMYDINEDTMVWQYGFSFWQSAPISPESMENSIQKGDFICARIEWVRDNCKKLR